MDAIIYFFTSLSVLNFVLASVCFLIGLFLGRTFCNKGKKPNNVKPVKAKKESEKVSIKAEGELPSA